MRQRLLFSIVILVSVSLASALAQENPDLAVGLKPFGSYHGGEIDSVSLTNGKLQLDIPLLSYPQRGGGLKFSFLLQYNNKGYRCKEYNEFTSAWDWRGSGVQVIREQAIASTSQNIRGTDFLGDPYIVHLHDVITADGSYHHVQPVDNDPSGTGWISVDATGIRDGVFDREGIRYTGGSGGTGTPPSNNNAVSSEDPNGNKITASTSGAMGWTDTLGRFLPGAVIADYTYGKINGNTLMPGVATTNYASCPAGTVAARIWNVPAPSGGAATIKFCYATVSTAITGGCGAQTGASGTDKMLSAAILPDGTKWLFSYSSGGDLAKVTLPTGGWISYAWGYLETGAIARRGVASRTVNANDGTPAGTWTYQYHVLEGNRSHTIVTDPLQNETTHRTLFGDSGYVDQVRSFLGSHTSGTLLKTVDTVYSGGEANPDDFYGDGTPSGPMNVVPTSVTTTLQNGMVSKVEKTWDTNYQSSWHNAYYDTTEVLPHVYGIVREQREYDYGPGVPGGLLRKTLNSYLWELDTTTRANNLLDLLSSTVIQDGSGNRKSETDYSYDQTAVAGSGVTTQHNVPPTGTKRGNPTSVSRWLNTTGGLLSSTATYFDTGMAQSATDPGGHATTFTYSSTFQGAYPTQVQAPATGGVTHITSANYDFNTGLRTSSTDENGQATTFSYDSFFRLTQRNAPGGGQVNWAYTSAAPFKVTVTSKLTASMNVVSEGEVDGLGRLKQSRLLSDPEGAVYGDTTYDALGRTAAVSNPYRSGADPTYGITSYQYDALSRVTKVIPPDGTDTANNVSTVYAGNCATVTDQAGKARKSCADALGRLTQVFEPDAAGSFLYETAYQYDTLDNLTRVDQKGNDANSANWRTRTFTYNSLSQLLTASNPESGTITHAYDNDGNLLSKQDARAITITYAYDALHRLTGKTYSNGDPAASFFYDQTTYNGLSIANGKGRRTGMSDSSGATAWSYDSEGRALTERRTISGITKNIGYTYNLDGSLASLTDASGRTVTYAYNAAARALSAVDSANSINYVTGATYAPQGAITTLKNGVTGTFVGITTTNSYNKRLQPLLLSAAAPSQTVLSLSYAFGLSTNDNGNVLQIQNNRNLDRTQSLTYDQLNRIATAQSQANSGGNCWGESFTYDIWGNLLNRGTTKTDPSCQYEPLSVVATTSNRISDFCYDAAGNLTRQGACGSADYAYDAENRLTSAGGVTYTYDGDGKRVKKSNGKMYWTGVGGDPLTETDLSGNSTADYVFFNGKRIARLDLPAATVHYYFSDYLGSHSVVTSASGGTIEQESDYYPFGGERAITGGINNYKFTGKERDTESGLDYFGARHYGSSMGRWMSPDEFTGGPVDVFSSNDPLPPGPLPYADITDPQSLNKYTYTYNNPLRYTDPDGHCVWDLCIGEAILVGAAVVTTGAVLWTYRDQIKQGAKGLGNAISNTFNSDEGNKNTPPPPPATSQTQTNTAPGGPNDSNNKSDKNDKKTEKADKQSEPGAKKDTSLEGRQNQLKDIEKAQRNQQKTQKPIDSIEKSKQNLKNSLKKIKNLEDAEPK